MKKLLIFIILGILVLRIFYYFSSRPKYQNGTKVKITSRVSSEPVIYDNSQYLKLLGLKAYLPKYPVISYGDRIVIEGKVEGDRLTDIKVEKIVASGGMLYDLRKRIVNFYQRSLPQPHSALVAGMTLGSKADIGTDFWKALKSSGTAHVVVASGMNVTLVASFLMGFFILILPRKKAVFFALFGIWIYVIISGFEAPIVRAAIMGSFAFTAQELGRVYNALRALFISSVVIIILKPEWIIDLGFILSFVATLSLIVFTPRIEKIFKYWPKIIREDLVTTVSAQIGVAPILFFYFGQFNILSPIINILVLWTVVPITIIGMFSGIIGTFYEPLGRLILLSVFPMTSWFTQIVMIFS